jgi:hypothetical protein
MKLLTGLKQDEGTRLQAGSDCIPLGSADVTFQGREAAASLGMKLSPTGSVSVVRGWKMQWELPVCSLMACSLLVAALLEKPQGVSSLNGAAPCGQHNQVEHPRGQYQLQ